MPLPSFLQRLRGKATSASSEAEQPPLSASDVESTRVRARRRLIGMVVLVGAGIIGFPWLFETQPRPMSPDVQMVRGGETADERSSEPTSRVALIQVPVETTSANEDEAKPPASMMESTEEAVPGSAPSVPSKPVSMAEPKAAESTHKLVPKLEPQRDNTPKAEPKVQAKPEPKAEAKVEPKPAKPSDPEGTRFVVQLGAFSDGITAYQVRMKVERLGIKTYTQEVKTAQGTRIRVRMGPYANRSEAEKALSSLRKGGLSGAILTL